MALSLLAVSYFPHKDLTLSLHPSEWAEFRDGIGKYLGNFEVPCTIIIFD